MKTVSQPIAEALTSIRSRHQANGPRKLPKSGWREVAGSMRDDEVFREAARLGEEWRQNANAQR